MPDAAVSQSCLIALKSLYAANGFVAVLLYLPQIVRAWNSRQQAGSLSLVTFGGWSVGSLITALYARFFVHDPLFAAVSLGNMAGSAVVFLLILRGRVAAPAIRCLPRRILPRRRAHYRQGTKRTEPAASLSTSRNDSTT